VIEKPKATKGYPEGEKRVNGEPIRGNWR